MYWTSFINISQLLKYYIVSSQVVHILKSAYFMIQYSYENLYLSNSLLYFISVFVNGAIAKSNSLKVNSYLANKVISDIYILIRKHWKILFLLHTPHSACYKVNGYK